jgi:hypothetical protein
MRIVPVAADSMGRRSVHNSFRYPFTYTVRNV